MPLQIAPYSESLRCFVMSEKINAEKSRFNCGCNPNFKMYFANRLKKEDR